MSASDQEVPAGTQDEVKTEDNGTINIKVRSSTTCVEESRPWILISGERWQRRTGKRRFSRSSEAQSYPNCKAHMLAKSERMLAVFGMSPSFYKLFMIPGSAEQVFEAFCTTV